MKDVAIQCNTEEGASTDIDVISVNAEAVAKVDVESDDMQMEADSEFVSDGVSDDSESENSESCSSYVASNE